MKWREVLVFHINLTFEKFLLINIEGIRMKQFCIKYNIKWVGNDLNFMIEFYEKVAKMSQIIQTCDFFHGQTV